MRRDKPLNPSLSPNKKRNPEPQKRKVRTDKLHDIKIPVSEITNTIVLRESRKHWYGSKTKTSTELLLYGLENLFVFPDVTYIDHPSTVHCKVDHETFRKIGEYGIEWNCSTRQAAHRIFMEALKKKQLGGITDGEI
ncbi:hypothetical protein ABEY41_03910 [Peribacillus butanolivorans]|uniref:hypothetical protein n=1 Tax=Peribacillus TaxID=2675229 RepID=UPI0021A7B3D0|nr:hypothetical protein [Peribacillus sp. BBB004]